MLLGLPIVNSPISKAYGMKMEIAGQNTKFLRKKFQLEKNSVN